jgi:hypothetical protein
MAVFVLTDANVVINSVVLSTYVKKVTLKIDAAAQDITAMGGNGYKASIGGLKSWSVDVEFNQDFAASAIDATLWPLIGTVVPVRVKALSTANSTTNPEYSGNVFMKTYQPIQGAVGATAMTTVTFDGAGALSRAVV